MLSVHCLVSLDLRDLTAGALLLVTFLCFTAVASIPGCTLTKPLGHIKGCLSPRNRPWMVLWWCIPCPPKVKDVKTPL